MIELLPDMPKGVTGVRVSGRLGGDELRELKPSIEEMLHTDEIRIVEVIGPDYEGFGPGGLFEDLKLAFGTVWPHHAAFKRVVVSDKEWVALALRGGLADSRRACHLQARRARPRERMGRRLSSGQAAVSSCHVMIG